MRGSTKFLSIISLIFVTALSSQAWAYYALLDNGEVLAPGKYKATGDVQILTEDGGLNAGGRFDIGFQEEFGARALAGFGETDFFFGGLFKWMPVPDIDSQPAIGGNIGILYAKDGDVSDMTFRFEPMLSKKISVEGAMVTPYAALPVGIRLRNSDNPYIDEDTRMTFQLVAGMQLQLEQWKNMQFMGEIGLDLDNAPAYLALAGVFYFDSENGFSAE